MKAARWPEVRDNFIPTEEDDHSVVIIRYDKMKAPVDEDYIRAPYKYDSLKDGIPAPPEKPEVSWTILTQDGNSYEVSALREDPPEWFETFKKE